MANYEIIKKESEDLGVFSTGNDNQIDRVFDSLIEVNQNDIIVRKNCKLCVHSMRFESEQKWEELNYDYTNTTVFINDEVKKHNEDNTLDEMWAYLTVQNVTNHMKNHYKEQERQIRLREYAKKIGDIVQIKQEKGKLLETALAVCFENLSRIASIDTANDMRSEKSRSDATMKIMSTVLSIVDLQSRIEGEVAAADIVKERFVQTWVDVINKEESDAKKAILCSMLEEFSVNFQ
jgi:hypothetical protein